MQPHCPITLATPWPHQGWWKGLFGNTSITAVSPDSKLAALNGPEPAVADGSVVAVCDGCHPRFDERLILPATFSALCLVPIPSPIVVQCGGVVYVTIS